MFCDNSFLRNELNMVNHVRDLNDANLVVLGISEKTGTGGERYRLIFEGMKDFKGINDTLIFESSNDATAEEIRNIYLKNIKIGLLPYLLKTSLRDKITYSVEENNIQQNSQIIDPWKSWVFSLSTGGWFNGEQSNKNFSNNSNFQVNKVRDDWKLRFQFSHNYSKSKFSYESYNYEYVNSSININLNSVWSVSSHWSAGFFVSSGTSTYSNYKYFFNIMPAIEYNIFPYNKSFEKRLKFDYRIGFQKSKYIDTTIFNKTEELNAMHRLGVSVNFYRKWGNIDINFSGNEYFHDLSLYSLGSYIGLNVRIVRGLSVYFYGGYSMIRNQINLARQEVSQEELLLRQRQMKTNFSYWGNVGISYTFGSRINNVVNPRFE
jgi:hypothetical protein